MKFHLVAFVWLWAGSAPASAQVKIIRPPKDQKIMVRQAKTIGPVLEMILLDSRPRLRSAPGGEAGGETLPVNAGGRVSVEGQAIHEASGTRWVKISRNGAVGWLPEALLAPLPQSISADRLSRIGGEPVDRTHGIPADYLPRDLVDVPHGYERGRRYKLRAEAAQALTAMTEAAQRASIRLLVVSAYRSYDLQRTNYLNKLKGGGWNQTTVAKPGHSEHQLGTTVDLSDGDAEHLLRGSFGDTPASQWLRKHAPEFGFAISYTEANQRLTGYSPEPWHYRYYGKETAAQRHASALGGGN